MEQATDLRPILCVTSYTVRHILLGGQLFIVRSSAPAGRLPIRVRGRRMAPPRGQMRYLTTGGYCVMHRGGGFERSHIVENCLFTAAGNRRSSPGSSCK